MTRLFRNIAGLLAATALLLGVASPAQGQVEDGIVSIELVDCTIVVTVAFANGSEDFSLQVWDDGVLLGTDDFSVPANGTGEGRYTITSAVQQGASGLGIVVNLEGAFFAEVDPYNGADGEIERCSEESTTPSTRPEVTTSTTATTTSTTRPSTTTSTTRPGSTTSTTAGVPSTTAQPTTTVAGPTTTPGSVGGAGARPPAAPPARPMAGSASYTG